MKNKRKIDEVEVEPHIGEVYSRNVKAHRHDVPFVNLTPQDMWLQYGRATRCFLSKMDMHNLDSIDPIDRAKQAQVMFAEV